MNIPLQIIKLDEIEISQHLDLDSSDNCYYWRKYTTKKDFSYGDTNQLIKNFRIPVTATHRLSHKKNAIEKIANEFVEIVTKDSIYQDYTFIPIPTSKGRNNPEYDDRLLKVLNRISELKKIKMDIRELIIQPTATQQAHTRPSKNRLSIKELCEIFIIQNNLLNPPPKKIIIFDDVLTKGSHFKAMQKTLRINYPTVPILGLFIARSTYPNPSDEEV